MAIIVKVFLIITLLAIQAYAEEDDKNCKVLCTLDIGRPVCASDGNQVKLFSSECYFKYENCKNNYKWQKMLPVYCDPKTEKKNCNRPCVRLYEPICAFDGEMYKIFDNQCILENQKCADTKDWARTKMSDCLKRDNSVEKFDSMENMDSVENLDTVEELDSEEQLDSVKQPCPIICHANNEPVCESDGKTNIIFGNECFFNAFNCKNNFSWTKITREACPETNNVDIKAVNPQKCYIPCSPMKDPVCGFDGKSYKIFRNYCELRKAIVCHSETWEQAEMVKCLLRQSPITEEVKKNDDSACFVACPKSYEPICGFNGYSYKLFTNKCKLREQNCKNEEYWIPSHLIRCLERKPPTAVDATIKAECNSPCTDEYNPVCGWDGTQFHLFESECVMHNSRCRTGQNWQLTNPISRCTHKTETPSQSEQTLDCPVACTYIYAPVCAFDGQQYRIFGSECAFKYFACKNDQNWRKTDLKACGENLTQ